MSCISAEILLIEDDARLAAFISNFLQGQGFGVTHFSHIAQLDIAAQAMNIDLVVCDIMLPGTSGFEIIKKFRKVYDGPFLFLSALSSDEHQLKGFELGADDYMVKPIKPELLVARVKVALQRSQKPVKANNSQLVQLGDLTINKASRSAYLCGIQVKLSRHEFDVLWLLALNKNHSVSRDYLFVNITGKPYDGMDRTIDGRISRLRKKINSIPESDCKIKTLWGQGYMLSVESASA
ncbi:response regulator transcription factor [Pseudoalteromonas sp. GB56]